jgi:hypothetical protein
VSRSAVATRMMTLPAAESSGSGRPPARVIHFEYC